MTKEEKSLKAKLYRDNMSPEMKAKIAESKRRYAEGRKDVAKIERAAYYAKNKDAMNAQSKLYHQKQRSELKALKEEGKPYKHLVAIPRPRKVMSQPADMTTLKDEAKKMGIATSHLRAISRDPRFHMPTYKLLRIDGMELYNIYELAAWQQKYREMLAQDTISGVSKNRKGITITPRVMLLINWMQETKHISKYCDEQRTDITSRALWSKYA